MMIRVFVSVNLASMFIFATSARLADPSGFAGEGTGYITIGLMAIGSIILMALIWSKRNFLRDE